MAGSPLYVDDWSSVHRTKEDCTILVRSNNGSAFYCNVDPVQFVDSPQFKGLYLECLEILRGGPGKEDGICYKEDATEWLLEPFMPLMKQLAPSLPLPLNNPQPTLAQYLFPKHFVCALKVTNEEPVAYELDTKDTGFMDEVARIRRDYLDDLDSWTLSYSPSDIKLCYDSPETILMKPPGRVVIEGKDGKPITCFYKPVSEASDSVTEKELLAYKKIMSADLPPTARICRLHGVVPGYKGLFGFLLTFVDYKHRLCKVLADKSSPELRKRWQTQIKESLGHLHQRGLVWGDAKAGNILIDKSDNAWIVDFGGGYTRGWVDKEKAGTVEGDLQALEKIMDLLS